MLLRQETELTVRGRGPSHSMLSPPRRVATPFPTQQRFHPGLWETSGSEAVQTCMAHPCTRTPRPPACSSPSPPPPSSLSRTTSFFQGLRPNPQGPPESPLRLGKSCGLPPRNTPRQRPHLTASASRTILVWLPWKQSRRWALEKQSGRWPQAAGFGERGNTCAFPRSLPWAAGRYPAHPKAGRPGHWPHPLG